MPVADADDQHLEAALPGPAQAGRYDAFVSYSRIDGDAARKLRSGLQTRGIAAWLDVEGIVGGEPWKARITSAIEACNAFVLLMSPDSIASPYCAWELNLADELGKLVVPVCCRDVDDRDLPELLAGLDVVGLTPGDDEHAGLQLLTRRLRDDLPWRARHTRIAARACAWRAADCDSGFVLVGSDLRKAEAWLGEQGEHGQAPNSAHRAYIVASRTAANRSQRTRMAWALVALAISAVLAIAAIVARDLARSGEREARSRALVAQAVVVADRDPGLAASLSLEAERVEPTAQARGALEQVLPRMGEALGELRGHTDEVHSIAMSPDGSMIASASDDGTVRLWDRATHAAIGGPLRGHVGDVWGVAFSPDGRTLASGGIDDRTVRLWEVASGRQIGRPLRAPRGQRRGITAVVFSPDGRTIAAATHDGTVPLWDVAARRLRGAPLGQTGSSRLSSVAYSSDGSRLVTAARDGTVRIWDVATRTPMGAPIAAHVGWARAVAFSPDGELLASGGRDGMVRLWDVATHRRRGAPFAVGVGLAQGVWSIAFAPGARTLVTSGYGARLWDLATRRPLGPVLRDDPDGVAFDAAFTPDGRTLVTATSTSEVRLWNVARAGRDRAPVRSWTPTVPTQTPQPTLISAGDLAFARDARTVAIVDGGGSLSVWDVATRAQVGARISPPGGARVNKVAWHPDGRMLATAGQDGTVRLWSAATRRQLGAPLRGHVGVVTAIAFSPDGRRLASAGQDKTVRLWSVARRSGTKLGSRSGDGPVAFSPDGRTVASAVDEGVLLWDVATRRRDGRPLATPGSPIAAVAFSPDGRLLAAASLDGDVRLWNVATRQRDGGVLRGNPSGGPLLAFSPDGETLATAGTDTGVRLWSMSTRRRRGPLLPHASAYLHGLAFSPDGSSLASFGTDQLAKLWDPSLWSGDHPELRARACAAGRRNLSRAEWKRYLPGEPYHETCPGA